MSILNTIRTRSWSCLSYPGCSVCLQKGDFWCYSEGSGNWFY